MIVLIKMKIALAFAASIVASTTAVDIKERLRQLRDPENVNPDVSMFRGCRTVHVQPHTALFSVSTVIQKSIRKL